MKVTTFMVAMIVIASLTSCAPTREEYETMHVTLQGSPAILNKLVKDCRTRPISAQETEHLADLMNVNRSRVRTVFCNRIHTGIASGRLTYGDVKAMYANKATPNMIKVMQGR